tara:strand:+ start:1796 stop:2986 length:1191 start_codon:yes stop_codon:yes gene_type:complete
MYTGPNLTNDDLVFGYDTGYGVADNSTATRFYPGEPATNNSILSAYAWTGDGGNQAFANKGATVITDNSLKYNGYDTVLWTPGGSQNCYLNGTEDFNYSDVSTVWTFSCYVKREDGAAITSLNVYMYYPGSDGNAGGTIVDCGNGWYRVSRTRTGSSSYISLAGFTSFSSGNKYYLSGVMLSKTNHTVPYVAVQSSRSSTASLIDLNKTTDIDVSNVSFDSTGQPEFDGTDDKGVITSFPHIWNSSLSVESVVSWDDDTRSVILGNYDQGTGGHDINFEKLSSGTLRFYWDRGSRDVTTTGNPVVTTAGAYHHVVFIRDVSTNNFRFYVDGELVTTVANAGSNIPTTGSTFRFGADTRNGSTVHNGSIPVIKAYSRVLTAAEITSNYNAYKNRFNI